MFISYFTRLFYCVTIALCTNSFLSSVATILSIWLLKIVAITMAIINKEPSCTCLLVR